MGEKVSILTSIYIDGCHNKSLSSEGLEVKRPVRLIAEFLGTTVLVMAVIGSGLLGERLSNDLGVVILINQVATVLVLGVLVAVLMPISGAHINPVVSVVMALRRELSVAEAAMFILAQAAGGVLGAIGAHAMFDQALIQQGATERLSPGTFLGEVLATAGLIAIILAAIQQQRTRLLPMLVPAWIGAAFFFTSSTSFANPAVTLGRMFTDSFTGIAGVSVPGFVLAQLLGGLVALLLSIPFRPTRPLQKEVS